MAAAVVVGYSSYVMVRRALTLRNELHDLNVRAGELRQKGEVFEGSLNELKTPEAVEREAKARLNLKRPGEEVVVVVPGKAEISATSSGAFWEKLLKFLR